MIKFSLFITTGYFLILKKLPVPYGKAWKLWNNFRVIAHTVVCS